MNGLRGPILSARLVRKPGVVGFGVGGTIREGRSKTRGRIGRPDSNASADVSVPSQEAGEIGSGNGLIIQIEGAAGQVLDKDFDGSLKTPRQSGTLPIPEKAASDFGVIQDVGKITCSWGD
jgi:hypothetical protein